MRAVSASALGFERLVETWNAVYAGYFLPMSSDVAQLRGHVEGGSIDLHRSLVWLDGDAPVALSLLGVRPDVPLSTPSAPSTGETASSVQNLRGERGWIGGFGIVPSHRRAARPLGR